MVTKAQEKTEYVEKLKRDIFKVDRSLIETERLIAKSRNAPYLPDLQFRLAELYVEKSRYVYFLQVEQRGGDNKGAIVSPETKLLKQKAVQLYNRLLREFPDFHDSDKVTFYLAHEMRELGQFDEMLKTLRRADRASTPRARCAWNPSRSSATTTSTRPTWRRPRSTTRRSSSSARARCTTWPATSWGGSG